MILASGGIKGGVGKTTAAVNMALMRAIAGRAGRRGRTVALIDGDDQGSATDYMAIRHELLGDIGLTFSQASGKALAGRVQQVAASADDVVIDVGGRDTYAQRAALTVADVYLVAIPPRSMDAWTLGQVEALVTEARRTNPGLRALSVVNFASPYANNRENADVAALLASSDVIAYTGIQLVQRVAVGRAADSGQAVAEYEPTGKAADEFTALYQIVFSEPYPAD